MVRSAFSRLKPLYLATGLLILLMVALGACQAAPAQPAAPAEPAAAEATATPAAEEEATAEPAEEMTATEEVTATEAVTAAEAMTATEETTGTSESGAGDAMAGDPAAGAYIATQVGCGCHMNRDLGALAGGNEFEVPTGVVYASNITPDPETGIGNWSAEEIVAALRMGAEPDGEQLHPVMPYMRLSALSDKEANDVAAWLLSLEPVSNVITESTLSEAPAAFTPAAEALAEPPSDPVARGQQLVTLANCAGCHTPKNEDGSAKADMLLAGSPLREEFAANITPDAETGIGNWSEADIAHYLLMGMEPDGKQVEGAMAQQIERRFSKLTEGDANAIAAYLKTIPAVVNAAPQ